MSTITQLFATSVYDAALCREEACVPRHNGVPGNQHMRTVTDSMAGCFVACAVYIPVSVKFEYTRGCLLERNVGCCLIDSNTFCATCCRYFVFSAHWHTGLHVVSNACMFKY